MCKKPILLLVPYALRYTLPARPALLFMPRENYIYNNITATAPRPYKMIFPFSEDCRCIIFHERYLWQDFYYGCVRCLYPFFIGIELFDGILIL